MHNSKPENLKTLSQKIKTNINLTCVAHQKCWVSPWGRKKDLAEASQSH